MTSLPLLHRSIALTAVVVGVACGASTPDAPPASNDAPSQTKPRDSERGPSTTPDVVDDDVPGTDAGARPTCRRTVCLTGAVDHDSGANVGFRAICESAIVRGRIDDCRSGTCKSTFGTFPSNDTTDVWNVVFDALDGNDDGKLDDADACELDVLGFSWGGVNAVDLARRMQDDPRVGTGWRVARLVLLDAFQPFTQIVVPTNVTRTVSFRHSVASKTDCSNGAVLGPYLGIPPRCSTTQTCADYDFSASPDQLFDGLKGSDVGHCDVPRAARANVGQILRDEPLTGAPEAVPVATP